MEKRYEMRFSGSGGQGVILASVIFAEAARPITEEGIAEILMGRKVSVSAGESSRTGAYGTIVVRLRVNSRNEMEELAGKLSKVTGVKFLL